MRKIEKAKDVDKNADSLTDRITLAFAMGPLKNIERFFLEREREEGRFGRDVKRR